MKRTYKYINKSNLITQKYGFTQITIQFAKTGIASKYLECLTEKEFVKLYDYLKTKTKQKAYKWRIQNGQNQRKICRTNL